MITDTPAALLVEDNPDDEELTIRGWRHTNFKHLVDVGATGTAERLLAPDHEPPPHRVTTHP
jgi:hypothetical protein